MKNMKHILLSVLITFTTFCQPTYADEIPTISPTATFTTDEGEETATTISGSALSQPVFMPMQKTPEVGLRIMNGDLQWQKRTTRT